MLAMPLKPVNRKVRKMEKIRIYHNTDRPRKSAKRAGDRLFLNAFFSLYWGFAESAMKEMPHFLTGLIKPD